MGAYFLPKVPFCLPLGAELYMVEQVSLGSEEGRVLWCGNLPRAWDWVIEVTGTFTAASEPRLRPSPGRMWASCGT